MNTFLDLGKIGWRTVAPMLEAAVAYGEARGIVGSQNATQARELATLIENGGLAAAGHFLLAEARVARAVANLARLPEGDRNESLRQRTVVLTQPDVELGIPGPGLWGMKVAERQKQNPAVIIHPLGMGQREFGPGDEAFDAVIQSFSTPASRQTSVRYSGFQGRLDLRQEVSRYFHDLHGLDYDPDAQVVIVPGGKSAVNATLKILLRPGDNALVCTPCWPYRPLIEAAHAQVTSLVGSAQNNFKITATQLEQAILASHAAGKPIGVFVITDPSNPTGAVYHPAELEAIAAVLKRFNIPCLADEFYARMIYDEDVRNNHASIAKFYPEGTYIIGGASKILGMAGWRVAWVVGPRGRLLPVTEQNAAARMISGDIYRDGIGKLKAFVAINHANTGNPDQEGVLAALKALRARPEVFVEQVEEFARRGHLMARLLNEMGLPTAKPEGSFYVFPDVRNYYGLSYEKNVDGRKQRVIIESDFQLAEYLLEHSFQPSEGRSVTVAVVPGIFFDLSGYIRLSYGCVGEEQIKEALQCIKFLLEQLKS